MPGFLSGGDEIRHSALKRRLNRARASNLFAALNSPDAEATLYAKPGPSQILPFVGKFYKIVELFYTSFYIKHVSDEFGELGIADIHQIDGSSITINTQKSFSSSRYSREINVSGLFD
jgi:hypothetical protein